MNPLWLPAESLKYGSIRRAPAGSIFYLQTENGYRPHLLTGHTDRSGVIRAFGVSLWPQDGVQGRAVEISHTAAGYVYLPQGGERLEWQISLDEPVSPTPDRLAGLIRYDRSLGMQLLAVCREREMSEESLYINLGDWKSSIDEAREVVSYFRTWRLRLHLSEREIVTVAEGPEAA